MKVIHFLHVLLMLMSISLIGNDVLIEFKAAGFFPTNERVKKIYGKAACLYGPEITFKLCDEQQWYGFASVDFLSKTGHSIGCCTKTKMELVPLAFGLKYFKPVCWGDLYAGLGFQGLHLTTKNSSQFVEKCTSKWGYGALAKFGAYYNLPCQFVLDFFVDYSFAKIGCNKYCGKAVPIKVHLSGVVAGAGIGYRFN